jgi:hypothetical protein
VLVCALDWGLGHASRSSVLVRSWVEQGASVTLAGNGRSLAFWRKEFPGLPCRVLPDYGIRYAPGPLLLPSLLLSLPRLASVRSAEYRLVQSWRDDFDAVVSDNRFGCVLRGKRSIFLTHQLHLAAPSWLERCEPFAEWTMARLLAPFDEIWIPDHAQEGLSGKLGHPLHPERFPALRWIGPLSRFSNPGDVPSPWSGPWDVLGLVSGPEPSRTDFERDLRRTLQRIPGRHLIVRGMPHLLLPAGPSDASGLQETPHLATPDLATALRGAKRIVSRGGYSTLMDLERLGLLDARCLLVPTPGQTEQEYLGQHLAQTRAIPWSRNVDLRPRKP